MKNVRVEYLVKMIEVLLPIYLLMKLTPNKTVAESWCKRSFLFGILNLTSWKELF